MNEQKHGTSRTAGLRGAFPAIAAMVPWPRCTHVPAMFRSAPRLTSTSSPGCPRYLDVRPSNPFTSKSPRTAHKQHSQVGPQRIERGVGQSCMVVPCNGQRAWQSRTRGVMQHHWQPNPDHEYGQATFGQPCICSPSPVHLLASSWAAVMSIQRRRWAMLVKPSASVQGKVHSVEDFEP